MNRAPAPRRAGLQWPLGGRLAAERPVRAVAFVCVALLVGACRDGPVAPGAGAPSVSEVVVTPNTDNALSGYVTFTVQGADSARVRCQDDQGATPPSPFNPVGDGTVRLVLLGLPRNAHCAVVVVATGAGGTSISTPAPFVAGDLPGPLQDVRLDLTSGSASTPGGYTLLEVTRDTVAFIAAFDDRNGSAALIRIAELRLHTGFADIGLRAQARSAQFAGEREACRDFGFIQREHHDERIGREGLRTCARLQRC